MDLGPMTPRWLNETFLNICIIIGAILGCIGIVFLFIKGFADKDAWLVTVLGAAVFFGFRWVKKNQADHEKDR